MARLVGLLLLGVFVVCSAFPKNREEGTGLEGRPADPAPTEPPEKDDESSSDVKRDKRSIVAEDPPQMGTNPVQVEQIQPQINDNTAPAQRRKRELIEEGKQRPYEGRPADPAPTEPPTKQEDSTSDVKRDKRSIQAEDPPQMGTNPVQVDQIQPQIDDNTAPGQRRKRDIEEQPIFFKDEPQIQPLPQPDPSRRKRDVGPVDDPSHGSSGFGNGGGGGK